MKIKQKNLNTGGRIDHGHHSNRAVLALEEFIMLDNAVGKSLNLTSVADTMTIVTADHSHTFTIGGDSNRGNPILGNFNTEHYFPLSESTT